MFPASRFIQAGATPAQVAQLQADFDALPPAGQQSYLDRVGGLAVGDLVELVDALGTEPEEEPGEEPDALTGTGPDDETAQTSTFSVKAPDPAPLAAAVDVSEPEVDGKPD
jgi:hypothetical protein